MLIQTKHLLTMLAVAGMTLFASQASATTYVAGDLLLGFRASGGQGASSNLIVNLGQADTVYRNATSNILDFVNIGTLLDATYGSNWNTRADLFWGVAGVAQTDQFATALDGDPTRTNYLSRAQSSSNPGTKTSTTWSASTSTTRSNIANGIANFSVNVFDAFSGAVTNTAVLDSTAASSWSSYNTGTNSFSGGSSIEGSFALGASKSLDLYRILNSNTGASPTGTVGTGSWEGTFFISDTGSVSFAVTAVPEPSRALLAGLGLAGIAFRRRRTVKKAA